MPAPRVPQTSEYQPPEVDLAPVVVPNTPFVPGGGLWLTTSRLKLAMLAAGFALIIFLVSVAIDAWMLTEHDSPRSMIEMSDAFAGVVAGALFFLYGYARRKEMLRRLETISLMNHHIRNALQVITSSAYLPNEKKEIAAIDESVRRIQWALREILPKI